MQEWLHLTGYRAAIYDWSLQDLFKEMCEGNGSFDMTRLVSPGLLGLEPEHTVVWVENHDTFKPLFGFDPHYGIQTNKHMAYAYAMHSQGLPLVFYHDYFRQPYYCTNTSSFWGAPMSNDINRLIKIRKKTVAGPVNVLYTNTDLYVQQRDGDGNKPGSILVLNDHSTSNLSVQVTTKWTNAWVVDLFTGDTNTLVQTDGTGAVTLGASNHNFRIYGLTNSLWEIENE